MITQEIAHTVQIVPVSVHMMGQNLTEGEGTLVFQYAHKVDGVVGPVVGELSCKLDPNMCNNGVTAQQVIEVFADIFEFNYDLARVPRDPTAPAQD